MRDFLITKVAGKLMMVTGIGGMLFSALYDKIVDRLYIDLGFWQLAAIIFFFINAVIGYYLDDFMRDM